MPIFEYQCESCGHKFDALQRSEAGSLRKCPKCRRLSLRKCLSSPAFHLRGKGWRKPVAGEQRKAITRRGHTLDSGPTHSHDDQGTQTHAHNQDGHTHSHGSGHGHSH